MNKSVENLHNEAMENTKFEQELADAGEGHQKPSKFHCKNIKIAYAAIYMGWRIGKGIYNESDYD